MDYEPLAFAPRSNPHITPRELDVLRLICAGYQHKVIAKMLGISTGTVKLHACNLYQKFGLRSNVQLALFALRNGLI